MCCKIDQRRLIRMTPCTGKVWSDECHHDSFSKRTEASEVSSVSTWNVSCSIGNYKLRFISSFQFALNSTQVTKYGCICPASWHYAHQSILLYQMEVPTMQVFPHFSFVRILRLFCVDALNILVSGWERYNF